MQASPEIKLNFLFHIQFLQCLSLKLRHTILHEEVTIFSFFLVQLPLSKLNNNKKFIV